MLELSTIQIQQPVHTEIIIESTISSTFDECIHDPQPILMPVLSAPQVQHHQHCGVDLCSFTVSFVE